MLDEPLLKESISSLRDQIENRRIDLKRLSEEIQHAERELQLLTELARLRGISLDVAPSDDDRPSSRSSEPAADGEHNDLQDVVIQILRGNGTPMHIQDLLARVRAAGVEIPGRGTSANLIASITQNPAIVRPVRGMYGLGEWGLSDRASLRRPKKPRRRGPHRKRARTVSSRAAAKVQKESAR